MNRPDAPLSLANLADASGATPRTIRYYIAQGLLPAPFGGGPATRYSQGHLDRLRLIRGLQRQHLPLAEIRGRLEGLTDAEVAALVDREPDAAHPPESAIDYIRGILSPPSAASENNGFPPRARRVPSEHLRAMPASALPSAPAPDVPAGSVRESTAVYGDATQSPAIQPSVSQPGRSQWERVSLDPDIELHVRRPLSRHQNRAVERVVAFARQVLEEDPS